jgi:hypothetical protein
VQIAISLNIPMRVRTDGELSASIKRSTIICVRPVALCAIMLAVGSALAADCGTSKEFGVHGSQGFAGALKDPAGLPIPGLGLELLSGNTVFRQLRTDNDGRFDLGRLPSRKYRLRIISQPFCAPKIYCREDACAATGRLRLNERKAKPVTVN